MSQEFSFTLAFEDFDRGLLPSPPPIVGSDEFKSQVGRFFIEQFQGFGGKARVIVDDQNQLIEVFWTKERLWLDPEVRVQHLLKEGRLREALPILCTLHLKDPDDTGVLYRLGMCYSELGAFDQAAMLLERLIEIAPENVHGLVALGVAEVSRGNLLIGEEWLRKALSLEPNNRWALRNLSGTLMKQERFQESLSVIQKCLSVAPDDIAMMVAYGDCLDELGQGEESDGYYQMAIRTGGPEHIIDVAKARLTQRAETKFRERGEIRQDVVQYMQDALQLFESMTSEQVQQLAMAIAVVGNQGLNINDPDKRYRVNMLPGDYTGLHLISILYAALQQFAPETNLGIDLRREFELASGKRE
jgi:tetratricopeptide (TPR) repeat protein